MTLRNTVALSWASVTMRRFGSLRAPIAALSRRICSSKASIFGATRCRSKTPAGARWPRRSAIWPRWARDRFSQRSRWVCPQPTLSAQILELYQGIAAAARRFEIAIAGGDLSRSDLVTISVTVVGEVSNSRVKTRAGGGPGDVLAVTGALGAARAGLELANQPGLMDGANGDAALQAFRRPAPRIAEGRFLAASANVTAMMDCSDGLSTDARRLCAASGCGAVLEAIAVADSAREVAQRLGEDPERFALAGGEDFELLVTVRARAFRYLAGRYEKRFKKKLLRVGALRKARDVEWRGAPLDRLGWDHFA